MTGVMHYWWCEGPTADVCVDARTEDAACNIYEHNYKTKPISIKPLPYPASPRIPAADTDLDHDFGTCPSFCWQPSRCAGKTSCPASPSCVE